MSESVASHRVIVADDQELTRVGLVYALEKQPEIRIAGQAENGEQVLTLLEQKQGDIVLMDVEMPKMDGILATQHIKKRFPEVKVVMLTSYKEPEKVFASFSAGADAYCMKNIKMERLSQVLDMVAEGAIWLDPAIARIAISTVPCSPNPEKGSVEVLPQRSNTSLTRREWDVLNLIVQGKSNKEIAQALGITIHTVKIHVSNILQKLAVDDRTQIAIKALKDGLVES